MCYAVLLSVSINMGITGKCKMFEVAGSVFPVIFSCSSSFIDLLLDTSQDLEESKRQREWAFGERDKIVSERDGVRVLCDQLRHERDGAVSDLFSALRDSDDIRRQKNDAIRELKEFRY